MNIGIRQDLQKKNGSKANVGMRARLMYQYRSLGRRRRLGKEGYRVGNDYREYGLQERFNVGGIGG